MAAITLDIGGNTRQLDRDIQKTVNKVYAINLKTKGDQPLGRITGKVNEFNKSLDASNARVIAFGASAGIIFGVERAFTALVSATIEVQKSLQDINVILNASQANLQKFGAELFSIARNTGQSFQEVAKAATEFSRQGLGIEETLKRTSEALILSRLSGLDAAKSVESLTAAVNSFASQAVTATEVVNKFATVDAAFAVSSADLADAIARVGSSAAQSGVSLNELIAIVTSAQQTTARGGAVIGNSFKTIFTRLQREKVVDLLGSLGISGTDASGQVKSTIQLLQDLGKVYDTLGSQQQAYVAEQVGGVFQINILKAALADLGKEYSIYSSALNVAAGATDQAIRRNEELNKTYSAQINALAENARQLAAAGGERLLGPSIDRLVGGTNTLLEGFSESDGQGVGTVLGKGILDGIGQFIAGPGLALIGGVLLKLFRDLAKFATGSVQQLLGLNTAATQQRDLQQSINQILAKNPQLLELALKGEQGLNTAANSLLASLQKQTVELQKQAQVAQQISKAFVAQAGVRVAGGVPVVPTPKTGRTGKAAGYIPNFAEELQAKEFGATPSVKAVRGVGKIGGKSFEANNQEFQFQNFAGTGETAVIPKYGNGIKEAAKMIARGESGSVLDKSDRNKAKGFVPNFAYSYLMESFAGKKVRNPRAEKQFNKFFNKGGFGNVERDDRISTVGFETVPIQLTPDLQKLYNEQPGSRAFTQGFEDYAIKQLKFVNAAKSGKKIKPLYGATSSAVDGYRITGDPNPKNKTPGLAEFLEVKGGGFETLSVANKFGRVLPENLGRFTQSSLGINYLNMLFKEGVPDVNDTVRLKNILAVPDVKGARKGNFNRPFKIKDIEANRAKNISRAKGFIPNFAKQKQVSKNAIDLGNLDTIPNKLGNKVVSLIYPGLSDSYSLNPATASYLKQEYTGKIPVAGINQKKLKSQIPDLDKNLGDLLVKEANQFGQSLGGSNFLQSAKDLPNFGAAQGAVGVAFEGGVQTLLTQKVARKQNAGIDFRNVTPRLRSIFNDAPGMYDAKSSSALTNEVFKKLLNETKPGATVKKTSGKAGEDYVAKRTAAVEQLRKEGVTGSVPIRQALRDRFGIVGKAAGYIPNFADSAILEQIQSKSSFNYKEIKNKPGIEKRINSLYQQYPDLQYLGSGAESHAFKSGNRVLKLPTLDYKTAKQQKAKAKEIGSIDWATATRQLKKAEPNLQLMPIRRVSGSSLVTSQRFAGNTFKDEINDDDVENSLMNLVESKFERAKASVSEKPNWLRALALDTGSSANFTFMRSLPKEVQIQAREGQIPPESLITSNKVGLIDPVIYGFMSERLWSEAKAKTGRGLASGFIPNFAAIQTPLQNAVNNEIAAGASSNQIRVDKNSKLKTSFNPDGFGVWSKKYEGSLPEGIRMAEKAGINPKTKGMPKAGGYIPNFAIEDPDVQATSAGTAISAVVAQLGFLAFSLQGSREQYKQSLEELTKTNVAQAKINSKNLREDISTRRFVGNQVGKRDFSQYTEAGEQAAGRQYKRGKEFGDMRRASRSPLSQERRDAAARELRAARNAEKTAARGTGGQKFAAAGQAGGFALSIGAPIIAETIKNAIGQETAGARRTGEAVGAAGKIASFAGAGAMLLPGPWGAAIGAATGALLTVPDVIAGLVTDFPELQKAANKAAQEVTQFGESSSRLLQASEAYTEVLSNAQAGPQALEKAQKALAEALNAVPAQYRDQLAEAAGTGKIPEVSAQIQAKLLKDAEVKAGSAQLGKSTGEARFSGLKQNAARALDFSALNLINKAINRDLSSNISDQFDPKNVLKQQENVDAIQTVVTQSLTGGEFTPEVVKALEKIPLIATNKQLGGTEGVQTTGGANEFVTEVKNVDDLRKFLESTGKFDPSNIGDLLAQAEQDFEGTVSRINESIATTRNETSSTVEAFAKASAKQKEYLENVRKASAAIDAASSSLEKNVAIQNLFKSAFENLQENIRSFSQNLKIEQTLTQPRQVLENLIGADKDPTRRLAAQEGLAGIRETERSGLATAGLELKGTIREILQKPFQENINKLRESLGQTKQGFKGDSTQIESQTSEMINQTATEYQNLNSVMQSVEGYMAEFVSGQISTQQLLEQSRAELAGVGIDVSRGSQASDAIEKAVAELEVKSIQEQVKAFQQRAKLASETKQAILQDKINQALGTFGGFEGFMNRPEEEQNYIQRIAPDLEKIGEIRSSLPFTYNNKESVEARKQQAPELARSFTNVYKQLIDQSGGAFRGFIQQGLRNRQLTSGQGGRTGKFGGFDDIIAGRQVDLEQQLKLAEDQLKITTDETLKRDLQGFIDSVKNMPGGLEGIATLQTQKELGVARESDFQKLFKSYDSAAFQELSKISPELAASLASASEFTDDPLLNQASRQTAVQTEILKTIRDLSGEESGIIEASKATSIDTPPAAKQEIDKKIATVQKQALPLDNRTIAEIEAEARAKRDQKLGIQSQTGIYTGGYINGMRADEAVLDPAGQQAQTEFEQFRSGEAERKAAADAELQRVLSEKEAYDAPARDEFELSKIISQLRDPFERETAISLTKEGVPIAERDTLINSLFESQKRNDPNTYALQEDQVRREMVAREKMIKEGSPLSSQVQNQPAAAAQQSFTQQEAAFSNNTSALTTLAGGIENLNSTLANFETNFANLNNVPGAQTAAGAQPNVTTTTNAPVNVVVNAQGSNDIAQAVGLEIQKKIPYIIDQVRLARGEKVPPTPVRQGGP